MILHYLHFVHNFIPDHPTALVHASKNAGAMMISVMHKITWLQQEITRWRT